MSGYLKLMLALVAGMLFGCSGVQTFPQIALPGDTVGLAIDWQPSITRSDVTVRVTDSSGFVLDIPGTDPSVRSWLNAYPDPISKAVVGRETKQNLGVQANAWGLGMESETGEKDVFETIMFMDVPLEIVPGIAIAPGIATFDVLVAGSSVLLQPVAIDIQSGTGVPNIFDTAESGPLSANALASMERADHYTVTFSGSEVPAAIQLDFSHDPDRENGGSGQAYVVHPRGDIISVSWTDTGDAMKVILMPSWLKTPEDINAHPLNPLALQTYKFYIAGGITGLQLTSVNAYDANGSPLLNPVSAIIQ